MKGLSLPGWAGRRVLVTGCRGFLGSWLVRLLQSQDAIVIGMADAGRAESNGPGLAAIPVAAELRDMASLADILREQLPEVVFHLAAKSLPSVARHQPHLTFEVNARGTWNLLEAIRTIAPETRLIFVSTDSVYGENDGTPFTESTPLAPDFPYEASKACAELAARCYARSFGLRVVLARFCNIYGPGDTNMDRLVAGTVEAVLGGQPPRLRGDGSSVRNYLYVEDATRALLRVADALDGEIGSGEAFNFCDEAPVSSADLVRRIVAVAGRPDLQPILGPGTPGEISIKRASAEHARRLLGWRPGVTLEEGLRRTIAWHRERRVAA
ncbi:NAD(P)-dependent oxidoreductase [Falsiroseomonas sp.]|uniref:NAD-dependent epimerase/dehydratase family protein n=1 Tax=Falsiroseomonas sp. TaxID=2870721 RepID=UPI002718D250|nr:NAD-dependent epimerase/dehydratase family protein [Falsiroseomonas sp.]MDO9499289.1 GDP-mannose 4,6-dehydratase [Falsiroseomonas sp.]